MRSVFTLSAVLVTCCVGLEAAAMENDETSLAALAETVERLTGRIDEMERARAEDQRRIRELEALLETIYAAEEPVERPDAGEAGVPQGGATGQGNLLNPQITAFLDMGGSLSTDADNKARNRFNFREAEVDLRAAVGPRADGVLVIAIGEEIEDPFGNVDVDIEFELEEGYLDVHTLPWDLALRAGKFRSAFGRSNLLHTHDLPQLTRPLAVQAFLGPEGLATVGASLGWLVPNPWDRYLELTAQAVNADGGAESPILAGPAADNPAVLSHLKFFQDVGETGSVELGSSFLYSPGSGGRKDGYTAGADLAYMWRDPVKPDFRSLLIQGELFWSSSDFEDGRNANDNWGVYAFGQYQFAQNWYAGARYDYTDLLDIEPMRRKNSAWGVSAYLSWYLSEALRLRLEYQHLDRDLVGGDDSEESLLLGLTFYIGAHPPHPYWVNR